MIKLIFELVKFGIKLYLIFLGVCLVITVGWMLIWAVIILSPSSNTGGGVFEGIVVVGGVLFGLIWMLRNMDKVNRYLEKRRKKFE